MTLVNNTALPHGVFSPTRVRESGFCDVACDFSLIASARCSGSAFESHVVELANRATVAFAYGISRLVRWLDYGKSPPLGANGKVFALLYSKCALLAELMSVSHNAMFVRFEHFAAFVALTLQRYGRTVFQLFKRDMFCTINDGISENQHNAFHEVNYEKQYVVSIPQSTFQDRLESRCRLHQTPSSVG